jgi:hypothetical protein
MRARKNCALILAKWDGSGRKRETQLGERGGGDDPIEGPRRVALCGKGGQICVSVRRGGELGEGEGRMGLGRSGESEVGDYQFQEAFEWRAQKPRRNPHHSRRSGPRRLWAVRVCVYVYVYVYVCVCVCACVCVCVCMCV